MTITKLPLAKEIDEFSFEETPVNETLVRDLAAGESLEHQRNVVLIEDQEVEATGEGPMRARLEGSGIAVASLPL